MPMLQYNLPKIQGLQPAIQPLASRLIELADQAGIPVQIVQGFRSVDTQQVLYESGKGVTNAPGGLSYHNYGLAFDLVPQSYLQYADWNPSGELWKQLGVMGESVGLEWGGRWGKPDLPHFQLPEQLAPIRELKAYWDKFQKVMPIEIAPSTGGAAMVLLVMGGAYLFHRFAGRVL